MKQVFGRIFTILAVSILVTSAIIAKDVPAVRTEFRRLGLLPANEPDLATRCWEYLGEEIAKERNRRLQ